jgi:hypothetical protein
MADLNNFQIGFFGSVQSEFGLLLSLLHFLPYFLHAFDCDLKSLSVILR